MTAGDKDDDAVAGEPFPGPEPLHHYWKHMGQSFEALVDSFDTGLFGFVFCGLLAAPLGTLSYLGMTKAVWRITHRR